MMIALEKPYFLEKEEWVKFDMENNTIELTEEGKKYPKVVKSFEDYYKETKDIKYIG